MLTVVSRKKATPSHAEARAQEADLVKRCKDGDDAAFREFYQCHRQMVTANLFRVMGHRGELEDLVQEVFAIAFRAFARFRGDSKLSTWLYRICVNVALGRLRKKGRKPPPIPMAEPPENPDRPAPETPERLLLRNEEVARCYQILDALSPKKRVVLVLHEIDGLDVKDIAEIVGAPAVTVRTRLHYARKEFYRRVIEQKKKGEA